MQCPAGPCCRKARPPSGRRLALCAVPAPAAMRPSGELHRAPSAPFGDMRAGGTSLTMDGKTWISFFSSKLIYRFLHPGLLRVITDLETSSSHNPAARSEEKMVIKQTVRASLSMYNFPSIPPTSYSQECDPSWTTLSFQV